jgi:uncharacterized protein (TIGR03084 family)
MADLAGLLADLADEHTALAAIVTRLGDDELLTPTPADGWTVRDQLSHLAGFDEAAITALREPDEFTADLDRRLAEGDDPIAEYTARGRAMDPAAVVRWWSEARAELLALAAERDPSSRVPWYGPSMSAMSFSTARLMETWAHGQDIRDGLGRPPEASDRLRHIAHLGVVTRSFSYAIRDREVPATPIDVVLLAPSGETWRWGPGDATDRVEGTALDFCLVVTQRRHPADVDLVVVGEAAAEWVSIAQAFAGGPGGGRAPGQFA